MHYPTVLYAMKTKISGRDEYQNYINSFEWKSRSEEIKEARGYRCQLCNISGYVKKLHVHHNTYERLGNELDSDLVVLCCDCHENFHRSSIPQANRTELTEAEIRTILYYNHVSPHNDDPWRYYEKGKHIIQHIIDGYNSVMYDKYNRVNISIVDAACENKREQNDAEDDNG